MSELAREVVTEAKKACLMCPCNHSAINMDFATLTIGAVVTQQCRANLLRLACVNYEDEQQWVNKDIFYLPIRHNGYVKEV